MTTIIKVYGKDIHTIKEIVAEQKQEAELKENERATIENERKEKEDFNNKINETYTNLLKRLNMDMLGMLKENEKTEAELKLETLKCKQAEEIHKNTVDFRGWLGRKFVGLGNVKKSFNGMTDERDKEIYIIFFENKEDLSQLDDLKYFYLLNTLGNDKFKVVLYTHKINEKDLETLGKDFNSNFTFYHWAPTEGDMEIDRNTGDYITKYDLVAKNETTYGENRYIKYLNQRGLRLNQIGAIKQIYDTVNANPEYWKKMIVKNNWYKVPMVEMYHQIKYIILDKKRLSELGYLDDKPENP